MVKLENMDLRPEYIFAIVTITVILVAWLSRQKKAKVAPILDFVYRILVLLKPTNKKDKNG